MLATIRFPSLRTIASLALLLPLLSQQSVATETQDTVGSQDYERMVATAIDYLRTKGQAEDGSFSSYAGPGVTALVVRGMLGNGLSPDDPVVADALTYIEGFVQETGGIHQDETLYRNYETSMALLAFAAANDDSRYEEIIDQAESFLKGLQWDEEEQAGPDELGFGGAGYGRHRRPDLSNTQFFIEALRAAGAEEDDEAIQRALTFVSRSQNLETEHNTTPFASRNPDGGFYYTPAAGGSSQAGETTNGGLRSYGSMTYAGLKSLIYCGVDADDPRMQAAFTWVTEHYTLESNPGMGDNGLYYYFHTFSKALSVMDVDRVTDADGVEHDWRAELIAELAHLQQEDGSWVNENARWLEGDATLVTGYALLSLAYCKPTTGR